MLEVVELPITRGCVACKDGLESPFPFSMALQPIVNVTTGGVFAYEALVRGPKGEGAYSVLSQVTQENRMRSISTAG